jgi:glycosyltransferase involved in cell wall biosynthesis
VAGEAALLVDAHDPDDLAEAMGRMLTEPELRQKLGASGLRQASSISWERTAQQTLEAYEQA